MKFIDEVSITVISEKGGPGAVSFRREALVPRGGPDGGDGGKGGDIIFRVDPRLHSLLDLRFKKTYKAEDGEPGDRMNRAGKDGADLILNVPPGTLIKDEDGHTLFDMAEHSELIFLKGGLGGKGNTFYKSSVNQAPTVAQKGLPGEERRIVLELKLIADVGIIGLPNAGKSTLISRISSAKPKIADYPFTTLVPNLGVVHYAEEKSFVVADIPGLIEGAHEGVGLGIQFLRHIERTRLFVHVLDVGPMTEKDPWTAYQEVRRELKFYDDSKANEDGYQPLGTRPEIIVFNKIDTVSDADLRVHRKPFDEHGLKVSMISAATGKNVKDLIIEVGRRVFDES